MAGPVCADLHTTITSRGSHAGGNTPFCRCGTEALGSVLGACLLEKGPGIHCGGRAAPRSWASPRSEPFLSRGRHPDTRSVLDCLRNSVFPEGSRDLSFGASRKGLAGTQRIYWVPETTPPTPGSQLCLRPAGVLLPSHPVIINHANSSILALR